MNDPARSVAVVIKSPPGPIYLNEEGALRHRMTGLAALNAVWRAVTGE